MDVNNNVNISSSVIKEALQEDVTIAMGEHRFMLIWVSIDSCLHMSKSLNCHQIGDTSI